MNNGDDSGDTETYEEIYGVQLLDDIHNYLPAILYNPDRFFTIGDLLRYVGERAEELNGYQYHELMSLWRRSAVAVPRRSESLVGTVRPPPLSFLSAFLRGGMHTREPPPPLPTYVASGALRIPANFFDPVPIVPSQHHIDTATVVRQATAEDVEQVCSVCQENYRDGDYIRGIHHCSHSFHMECIDRWFLSNVHCPLCRYDIREWDEDADTDSVS
jgi:hypothetical protein